MENETKIKGFYQKGQNSNQYYQLGVDGKLVDMLSGFNLEEELKLSLPSEFTINEATNNLTSITTITQKYQNDDDDIIYTLVTRIINNNGSTNTQILKILYRGDSTSSSDRIGQNSMTISEEGI